MNSSFELQNSSLEIRNLIIESILLCGVCILKFFDFLSINVSESADLVQKMSDFSIFQVYLSIKNLELSIFVLYSSV